MQGVMMELVDSRYVDYVHGLPFNPYSQHCLGREDGTIVWTIHALDDTAAEQIVTPLSKAGTLEVRKLDAKLEVAKVATETVPLSVLADRVHGDSEQRSRIEFVTPTAFKTAGSYAVMPSVKLIFQNLLMRYGQVYGADAEADEDTVSYIEEHVHITSYNLKTRHFENIMRKNGRIPAFVGSVGIRSTGAQPLIGLVRMLVGFAQYSGIGIKTSMGMGAVRCK